MAEPAVPMRSSRRLLLVSAVFGMAAIVALPLTATAGGLARLLVFATPIVVALNGLLRQRRVLVQVGVGVTLALLVLLALAFAGVDAGPFGLLAPAVLLVGPVVAVAAVGLPLREVDVGAAAGFLLAGTIAVIAGFAAAATPGATTLILGVAAVGLTVVAYRLEVVGRPPAG